MSGDQADHRHPADSARARLAALQDEAARVYAAICAADEALRVLAARRVAAERDVRALGATHLAATQAAAAHALDSQGPLARLAGRFRGGSKRRAGQDAIQCLLAGLDGPLTAARLALAQVKGEFTAQLAARAELAATLRGLTAECAAAQEELARDRRATMTREGAPCEDGKRA